MPNARLYFHSPSQPVPLALRAVLLVSALATANCLAPALGAEPGVARVRAREVALAYALSGAGTDAVVDLWYTRDRGQTWLAYELADQRNSPLRFVAPAEGLYGFVITARENGRISSQPPSPGQAPQRWVFIDYTPPLLQWDGVEPADDFHKSRQVRLRWTAYDDNLPSRPVSLAYQNSVEQIWHVIAEALPNTGRFDWTIPDAISGRLTFKIMVQDEGGHVVERVSDPLSAERWFQIAARTSPTATQPASAPSEPARAQATTTQPAASLADAPTRRQAMQLYQQGRWHQERGQYAQAAERFREAIELDPDMHSAWTDLAGTHYLQKDYAKAVENYESALRRNAKDARALRGAFLAAVAQKQYPASQRYLDRLLALDAGDSQAWLDRGDVMFMMGDVGTARDNWTRALSVNPAAQAVIEKARGRLETYAAPALKKETETAARD